MNDISAEPTAVGIPEPRRRQQVVRGPLTFQQLFLSDYFNLHQGEHRRDTFVFRIIGSVDSALLAKSLNEIVRRHDCLRTRIVMTDGCLEQYVDEPVEFDLAVIDLADVAPDYREGQATDFLHEFAGRKYDLAVEPPMDAALIRISAAEHLFAWAVHHIIADGITIGIVLGEMWSIYGELLQRTEPHTMCSPVRYLDYALWQHSTHEHWLQQHENYWKDRIAGATCARWPADPCVAPDRRANAWLDVKVGMPSLADLRGMARSTRTTPAMVMLTVYAALVARWCGQRVVTIPVNVSGRHCPEHEHAAGYFAHFLYVRVEIEASKTFRELLAEVSGEFRGALMHQDFGKVAARVPDVLRGSMFSWVPWKSGSVGVPTPSTTNKLGITVQPFPFTRPYLLEFRGIGLFLCAADEEYSAALWYRTDSFSTSTVEQFASELRAFCERVMATRAAW